MECTADLLRGHPTTGKAGRDNAQAYAGSIRRDRCLAPGGDMSQPIRGRDSETSGNDDGKGNARCLKRKFSSRNLRPASMTCLGCLRPFHEKGKARTRSSYATHPITPGCQHANMSTCQNTEHIHESAGHAAGDGSEAPPRIATSRDGRQCHYCDCGPSSFVWRKGRFLERITEWETRWAETSWDD